MTYLPHLRLGLNLLMLAVFSWSSEKIVVKLKQSAATVRRKIDVFDRAYGKYSVLFGLALTFGAFMVFLDLPVLITAHLMFQHFMQSSLTAFFPLWSLMGIMEGFLELCEDEDNKNNSVFKLITPFVLTFIVDRAILGNVFGEAGNSQTQQVHSERTKGFFMLLENMGALPQYIFTGNTAALTKMWNTLTKIHSPAA